MRHHSGPSAGMPSQRQLRVGELIRHALADLLTRREVIDPVLETHIITVTEVRMSPDLKHATCFVEPLGGADEDAVVKALEKHRKFMRGQLNRQVELRFSPELHFQLDTRFDDDTRVDKLLKQPKVAHDLEPGDDEN
ncbi:30S ribosome-binding factor RbfA [Rhodobium gokarnense]|uniref:Ribosome-binding factor A n=1 Tax=Rhodobium gokarnense TaxID=364296 RepID=A0ABT3HII3_9HYPH|nr:30S ribosome-binding factor RbfA [Rhodobium gokarnense]MCW2310099.1 ribosome-binding factor A [Rhodobium gokarnense]